MTSNNNQNIDSTTTNNGTSLFSMLVDAAEGQEEVTNVTTDINEPSGSSLAAPVGNSTTATAIETVGESAGDPSRESLEMSVSAAHKTNIPAGAAVPLVAAASIPVSAGDSNISAEACASDAKSRTEAKKRKAALLKAAKALSNDPLVQLSMLRAMQQQQIAPEVVQKNKEEREKAAQARQRRLPKKRRAPVPVAAVAAAAPVKKRRHSDKPLKQPPMGSSTSSSFGGPVAALSGAFSQPQSVPAQSHNPTGPLDVLMAGLNQPQITSVAQPQIPVPVGGTDIAGTLHFLQMLLGMMNNTSQQAVGQPMAGLMALQGSNGSILNGPMLDLIQNIGASMTPQQKISLAQSLIPHLGGGQNSAIRNPVPVRALISQGNGASALTSSLNSPLPKNSQETTPSKETKSGQEVRIPCRARGMPPNHNFQTAHFVLPKGVEHGQDLVCSYPVCRDGGVKFRYCLFCRIPVAKRNFRLRHNHAEVSSQPPVETGMKIPSTICVAVDSTQGKPEKTTAAEADNPYYQYSSDQDIVPAEASTEDKKRAAEAPGHHLDHVELERKKMRRETPIASGIPPLAAADDVVAAAAAAPKKSSHKKKRKDKKKHSKKRRDSSDRKTSEARLPPPPPVRQEGNFVDDLSLPNTKKPLKEGEEKRLYMWATLLGSRPSRDAGDSMSKWLMNVLAVSDPTAPLKDDMSDAPSPLSVEGFDSSGLNSNEESKRPALAGGVGGSDSSD